jgi:hypothetical protein
MEAGMRDAGSAERAYRRRLTAQFEDRARTRKQVEKFGLAWLSGHHTLYKFKGFSGEPRKHVLDIIRNSRVYFSAPSQFNDPLDCAPIFQLARPVSDTAFVEELRDEEAAFAAAAGKSPQEIERMRRAEGVPAERVANAVTASTRKMLDADTTVFCLSAEEGHPLLWSHYADSHRGVCLHFKTTPGSLFGLARTVRYRRRRLPILIPLRYNRSKSQLADLMASVKAEFWRYEHEYRIFAHKGIDWGSTLVRQRCSFDPRLLSGLTLGMRISTADRRTLIRAATQRHPPVAVYQAEEAADRFWVESFRIA